MVLLRSVAENYDDRKKIDENSYVIKYFTAVPKGIFCSLFNTSAYRKCMCQIYQKERSWLYYVVKIQTSTYFTASLWSACTVKLKEILIVYMGIAA